MEILADVSVSKHMRRFVIPFLVAVALSITIQLGEATSINFSVPQGGEETRSLNLVVEDRVSIRFTVVGQTSHTLNFYVKDSDGETMAEFPETGSVDYRFTCVDPGEYTLRFENPDASETKFVTLNYEIQHYVFGMPQMLFLTIIVVLVCIGAVTMFVLMGRPH